MTKTSDKPACFTGETSAPRSVCCFEQPMDVFAAPGEPEKKQFRIVAYSGGIIRNHWFWGNLAFDLAGLRFAKKRTPILESHNWDRRVGYTTKQEIGEQVTAEGSFLNNARAQELRGDLAEGFPMQASLYVPPQVVERVEQGASVQVNGHTLAGPGSVFREATIKEISMIVFGADGRTSSTTFGDADEAIDFELTRKESEMDDKTKTKAEMTPERFASEFPDVFQSVVAAAAAEAEKKAHEADQRRFAELRSAVGDDPALLVACFADGKTVAEALTTRNAALAAEVKELRETRAQSAQPKVDPVDAEFQNAGPTRAAAPATTEEGWAAEFTAKPVIQAEFGTAEAYVAFKQAEAEGRVEIHGQ